MQARSAAARAAVQAYAARSAFPVRCSSVETEKSILAQLNGRPNDEDMVAVLSNGMDKQFRDRWAAVRRNVILTSPDSKIVRNEVEEEVTKQTPGKTFKVLTNPRSDILVDASTACLQDMITKKKVYFFDALSVGVAAFARVKVDFVTDDASVAKFLNQALPRTPRSAIPASFQPQTTALLLHSSTKDEQAGGLDAYVMYDSKNAVARGVLPKLSPLLDVFADIAAQRLVGCEVLVARGDIRRDDKTGVVTLVLGSDGKAAGELHGARYAAFASSGVSRLFEGSVSDKDEITPLAARSSLSVPKRIVFVSNKDGKSTKPVELEAAKKLFVEKFAVAPSDKTGPLFEKLVQAHKIELVTQE